MTDVVESVPKRNRPYWDLFLISFLVLFLELACIRWFGSTVVYLTFFTNIALMACFLGTSVGCLAASKRLPLITTVLPLLLLAALMATDVLQRFESHEFRVSMGNQQSPQLIYFGTERGTFDPVKEVPVQRFAGEFFLAIALVFIGLGQVMGRAFDAVPDRVRAYTVNVLGSLAGIVAFALISLARLNPIAWFGVAGVITLSFLRDRRLGLPLGLLALIATLFVVSNTAYRSDDHLHVFWSPYYKIVASDDGVIETNNIGHQKMISVADKGAAYALPYYLARSADRPPFQDVLIIGAGSGNDVQAALSNGAGHVDAVEIDPVINEIGRANHPDRPFDDPRVTVHIDDGRNFLRKTNRKYDLIIYALVDSLVLHSGYSSLRLESFLFTEQALRDVKARLKPGGAFVMYNYFRQGWAIGRLTKMAHDVFGHEPIVTFLPYRQTIQPTDAHPGFTVLITGDESAPGSTVTLVRTALQKSDFYWIADAPKNGGTYSPKAPQVGGNWLQIGPTKVTTSGIGPVPTDNWPFLYLRSPRIPNLIAGGMAIVGAISLVLLLAFAPLKSVRFEGRMFFLGAGFMLLETKSVVHLALLFGSTWIVNSIVFAAVLVMILASNLFVLAVQPRRLEWYYALLVISLLLGVLIPLDVMLGLPGVAKVIGSCALVFAPIFFAGAIFATSFRDCARPDVALGANIAGVILGGLSENLSLVVGMNGLLLIALAFYALSYVFGARKKIA